VYQIHPNHLRRSFSNKEILKYLSGSFPNLQLSICEKWRDIGEEILSDISLDLAKLKLSNNT
jgi:hypothetical protein